MPELLLIVIIHYRHFFALTSNVLLQATYWLSGNFDLFSEGAIISLSGVSKSGADCIIQADAAGDGLLRADGVEL